MENVLKSCSKEAAIAVLIKGAVNALYVFPYRNAKHSLELAAGPILFCIY